MQKLAKKILKIPEIMPVITIAVFITAATGSVFAQKRAMTLEDVMNFMHMSNPVISENGHWAAYGASPDRGDGYGIVVSSDKSNEYLIERGRRPSFSANGNWALFTVVPPFDETQGGGQSPNNSAALIETETGQISSFDDVRSSNFTTKGDHLIIHHHRKTDSSLDESEQEKMKQAGTELQVKNLSTGRSTEIPFVESYTVDSLSSVVVYSINDTAKTNNGLYYLSLSDISRQPQPIDTTGNPEFGDFAWLEKKSTLAFMRRDRDEKDETENAKLFIWEKDMEGPQKTACNESAPEGLFLPFDNDITWSYDGERLFMGFRPQRFSQVREEPVYKSVLDSLEKQADIDVWHGEDPLIKTHEKSSWNSIRSQNLLSVFHTEQEKLVVLADEEIPDIRPSKNGMYALGTSNVPYMKRITWEGRFRDVYLFNLNNGEKKLLDRENQDIATLSPCGRFTLFFSERNWHVYDAEKEIFMNLTENLEVPFYDEDMDRPAEPSSYRTAGWVDDNESVLLYDKYDIWRINLLNGEAENITDGKGRESQTIFRIRNIEGEPVLGRRQELFIEGFNEKTKVRAIYTARTNRKGVSKLYCKEKNLRLREASGDGSTVLFTRETYDEFPDLWVAGRNFRNPVKISDLGEQLEQFAWGTAELISWMSADGIPLQGAVIKPDNYDPGKKYPVFVYYYNEFSQRVHEFNETVINHRPCFAYYASNDYVVFLPDIHFIEGRPGMSAVKSLVPGVQKLIDKGVADPDAIGLHGHSWSGYMTAFVVTQTDIFAAAIAGAPVSNMTSAYGGIRWGSGLARQFQYETGQSRIGGSIFEDRDLYIENSPLFYADEINTPLLIMHGDVDEAVPWEQSIELYLAMRRAGKDIIFLQYRDEPHHPRKYPNKLDYTIRMREYFDYHLKGKEPAGWIIDGVPYTGN